MPIEKWHALAAPPPPAPSDKPTIGELEALLNSEDSRPVRITPDGKVVEIEPLPEPPPAPSDGLVEASVYASAVKGRTDFRAAYREARARITELEAQNSEVWEKWKGLRDDCIKCETKLSDIEAERDALAAQVKTLREENEKLRAIARRIVGIDGGAWHGARYAADWQELKRDAAALASTEPKP